MRYLAIYLHFDYFGKLHSFHFSAILPLCEKSTNFEQQTTIDFHSTYCAPPPIFNSLIICALTFAHIYI